MLRPLLALAVPCLLLTACGDEPDEAAMRTAVEKRVEAEQHQMRQMRQTMSGMASGLAGGRPAATQAPEPSLRLVEFRKGSCREAQGQPGHMCDFTMTVELDGARNTSNASGRFFKAGSGPLEVEIARR
ncbi:hypothetical protein [Sabulicella rubraurantiaca]|uniref:hypothetical protein n=1 Tax=Sabulicella rubraurantiaca TaxID=2811429 RepID=UPI001A96A8AA|nr:hypothetical protein [Sabulicella rubraurantiaca]